MDSHGCSSMVTWDVPDVRADGFNYYRDRLRVKVRSLRRSRSIIHAKSICHNPIDPVVSLCVWRWWAI